MNSDLPAPLWITVGPPCSGKSTFLKNLTEQCPPNEEALVDISLDDQPNVYIPIPFALFVMSSEEMKGSEVPYDHQYLLNRSYYQKGTVRERILAEDQQELRLVLHRISGKISKDEFEAFLRSIHAINPNLHAGEEEPNEVLIQTLLEAVEDRMVGHAKLSKLPKTVNLFMVEALFQRDPKANDDWTGVERAINLLKQTPKNVPVSWGNTNTKPGDYTTPLEIAQAQGRPVRFCVYGDNDLFPDRQETLFDLPQVDFRQLVDRNLQRLIDSGQYIPCKVIQGLSRRTEILVGEAISQLHGKRALTKRDLERELAALANFELQKDGTVKARRFNVRKRSWTRSDSREPSSKKRQFDERYRARGRGADRHQSSSETKRRDDNPNQKSDSGNREVVHSRNGRQDNRRFRNDGNSDDRRKEYIPRGGHHKNNRNVDSRNQSNGVQKQGTMRPIPQLQPDSQLKINQLGDRWEGPNNSRPR